MLLRYYRQNADLSQPGTPNRVWASLEICAHSIMHIFWNWKWAAFPPNFQNLCNGMGAFFRKIGQHFLGERVWVPSIPLGWDQGGFSSPPPCPLCGRWGGPSNPFPKKILLLVMIRIDVNDAGSPPRGPAVTTVRKQNQQNKKKKIMNSISKKKKISKSPFFKKYIL